MMSPLQKLREWMFGKRDLGAGRVDRVTNELMRESERIHKTIKEISETNDPLATLVRNMKSSRRSRTETARTQR